MQTKGLMRSNRWRRTRAGPRRDHSIISAPISRKQAPPLRSLSSSLREPRSFPCGRAAERRRLRPLMSVGAIGGGYEMHICSDRERTDGGRKGERARGNRERVYTLLKNPSSGLG